MNQRKRNNKISSYFEHNWNSAQSGEDKLELRCGCVMAALGLRDGCVMAAWWLRGGCVVAAWWLRGGCVVAA